MCLFLRFEKFFGMTAVTKSLDKLKEAFCKKNKVSFKSVLMMSQECNSLNKLYSVAFTNKCLINNRYMANTTKYEYLHWK